MAYFHAGIDTLRSKSLDRNSFNSGDWFNPLDWTATDNGFGRGLPPAGIPYAEARRIYTESARAFGIQNAILPLDEATTPQELRAARAAILAMREASAFLM